MIDEVASAYKASDFLKDGSFQEISEFEKAKRKTALIENAVYSLRNRESMNIKQDVTEVVHAVIEERPYNLMNYTDSDYYSAMKETLDQNRPLSEKIKEWVDIKRKDL